MNAPKVFVTHASHRNKANLSSAEAYGEVVFLSTDEYMPEPSIDGWNKKIVSEITHRMKDYIPGLDYILTSGSPISMIVVGMALCNSHGDNHQILKWNSRDGNYERCLVNSEGIK